LPPGRLGTRIRPLVLADGRLAIDVDDFRSLKMAEQRLAKTAAPGATVIDPRLSADRLLGLD
jgi:hypothetical protein